MVLKCIKLLGMRPNLLLLLSIIIFSYGKFYSQNFTVGTPVSEIVSSFSYSSNMVCYPDFYDVTISYPQSSITGVQNIIIVTDITGDEAVKLSTGDSLTIGDTLANIFGDNHFTIYSTGIFTINFDLKVIGTPELVNEMYPCGDNYWIQTMAECSNSLVFTYYDNSIFCYVNDLPGIQPYIEENFSTSENGLLTDSDSPFDFNTYLNSETNILTIENSNNFSISEINLIGLLGERILLKMDGSQIIQTDLSNSNLTVFYLEIKNDNKVFRKKIIKGA